MRFATWGSTEYRRISQHAERRSVVIGLTGLCALVTLSLAGCLGGSTQDEVVVYTALDREFSEPIFDQFTAETGIAVRATYDTEANKTVGLVNLILNERQRPRCDLFWNNEIVNTLRLDHEDLLLPCTPENAAYYPTEFRSETGDWFGFAARARVLLVNQERWAAMQSEFASAGLEVPTRPDSIFDLADPEWEGRVGIAKPLFGTTATHAACLFAALGEERASDYFRDLQKTAIVFPGNRQVAQAVGSGQLVCGLTDTDDAMIEIRSGQPVEIVYPDQEPGGLGTLFLPNTLAVIKNCPHPEPAKQLLNYLLSAETEQRLAAGESSQIPLNSQVKADTLPMETPATLNPMVVDFRRAREEWDAAAKFIRHEFLNE